MPPAREARVPAPGRARSCSSSASARACCAAPSCTPPTAERVTCARVVPRRSRGAAAGDEDAWRDLVTPSTRCCAGSCGLPADPADAEDACRRPGSADRNLDRLNEPARSAAGSPDARREALRTLQRGVREFPAAAASPIDTEAAGVGLEGRSASGDPRRRAAVQRPRLASCAQRHARRAAAPPTRSCRPRRSMPTGPIGRHAASARWARCGATRSWPPRWRRELDLQAVLAVVPRGPDRRRPRGPADRPGATPRRRPATRGTCGCAAPADQASSAYSRLRRRRRPETTAGEVLRRYHDSSFPASTAVDARTPRPGASALPLRRREPWPTRRRSPPRGRRDAWRALARRRPPSARDRVAATRSTAADAEDVVADDVDPRLPQPRPARRAGRDGAGWPSRPAARRCARCSAACRVLRRRSARAEQPTSGTPESTAWSASAARDRAPSPPPAASGCCVGFLRRPPVLRRSRALDMPIGSTGPTRRAGADRLRDEAALAACWRRAGSDATLRDRLRLWWPARAGSRASGTCAALAGWFRVYPDHPRGAPSASARS